jgi:hypothetical protein
VLHVGYQEQKKSVRVLEGQVATLDFSMANTVVQLDEVVTTAAGEQRRAEVGNSVDNISVAKLTEVAPVRDRRRAQRGNRRRIRATGTQTGSGQRIRVRGISSVSLSNEPIFSSTASG